MSRHFKDWINAYLHYNTNTESATVFHKWAAISAIAGVLRRKAYFNFGRIKVHPNLYIVLVAEPGRAKKTQAITFMEEFLGDIYGIHIAADSTTPQALLQAIEEAADEVQMNDGTNFRHCSLSICSGEFESFLGNKKENSRMIVLLTDLFDCKSRPFVHRTKHAGINTIPLPFLNIIAATTPGSLAECFPSSAIGGGLNTRMLFVYAKDKAKKVAIPEMDEIKIKMHDPLMEDLSVIGRMQGEFNFSPEGKEWWLKFYDQFEENDPNRLCKDPSFSGWYSRKPLLILKVATSVSAARGIDMYLKPTDLDTAKEYIEEIEPKMGLAFSAVGRSDITADVDLVRKILQQSKTITETALRRMIWRDIDERKFPYVIDTIVKGGDARRTYSKDKTKIYYTWKGGF